VREGGEKEKKGEEEWKEEGEGNGTYFPIPTQHPPSG
jgi:hypothetical protein